MGSSSAPRSGLVADLERFLKQSLAADERLRADRYPNPPPSRQPVHTAYIPADRFSIETVREWSAAALAVLDLHGPVPNFSDLDEVVRAKITREPIEDLRIDFEDGYGLRPDEEEDAHAVAAAGAVRLLATAGELPPFVGIRVKCLEAAVRVRSVRTLMTFVGELLTSGALPDGFRITLPKVTSVAQVQAFVHVCATAEEQLGMAGGSLRFELQVETPQAVMGPDGQALIAPMLHACAGRCAGLHYGTYDYSASVGIAAGYQSMEHPAADYAKAVMQVAAAGTGVPVSDGSTNVLPVGDQVLAGWALHARLVRRSLERGFYQGWDLHPAQLPTRYAATFRFYQDGLASAVGRLHSYLARVSDGVLDEPATARALAGFILRGLDCGAIPAAELDGALDRAVLDRLVRTGL